MDNNSDGLPDAGYGICVSHLDADTTDTAFEDLETPRPGMGFFYLRAVAGAIDIDLGTTSDGLPRAAMIRCP